MEQRALDCNTGLNRELTTNEQLLVQNDKHLSSHLKMQDKIEQIEKRINQLETKLEELEEACSTNFWTIYNDETEELKTLNPNTNID